MYLRVLIGCAAALRGGFVRLSAGLHIELHAKNSPTPNYSTPLVDRPLVSGGLAETRKSSPAFRGSNAGDVR